ncbi:putative sh3 domain protein [Golovinomyces cichoracearum]|uniref:Putative sh3 domain protein n=1 Tax=Golovinomyces cichoracearum TaxID=62708 RepID=A0A420IBA5_9PEZI|nr:putative sh3 domain protein [Golovinomyces cichoracearum]
MVLLDDTNSYWWLVRVVKDMTIGYLPAEHIETPSERLARLNKHRNIDLASKMLGDQAERHQNSLIKAFRKRSLKTVSFTDPTYIEASDIDYSTEEDEFAREFFGHMTVRDQTTDNQEKMDNKDENINVISPKSQLETEEAGANELPVTNLVTNDSRRTSNESADERDENKSRSGSHRNTDSFFQDDSVETRKITLTPNLLRDDSTSPPLSLSNELKDQKLHSLDKTGKESPDVGKDKKERKEKKEKEKKPGMLSGLFKRKDRKNKSIDEDIDEILGMKQLNEPLQSSLELNRDHDEVQEDQKVRIQETKTQSSNLEKQSGSGDSPLGDSRQSKVLGSSDSGTVDRFEPSPKIVPGTVTEEKSAEEHGSISDSSASTSVTEQFRTGNDPVDVTRTDIKTFKSNTVTSHGDIDSSTSLTATATDSAISSKDKPSETPMPITSTNESNVNSQTLVADNSSQDGSSSPISSASLESLKNKDLSTKPSIGNSTALATINTSWNDVNLKTYFENNFEIKDMLINVFDNSGVIPAGPEHPLTGNLFKEENVMLADIASRLNGMLENWLDRKIRTKTGRL